MLKLLSLLVTFCVVAAWSSPRAAPLYDLERAEEHFEEFVKTHQKLYQHEEERQMRFQIFKENLEGINRRNVNTKTAVYGIDRFTDMTVNEFLAKHTGFRNTNNDLDSPRCDPASTVISDDPVPEAFDWRDQKKVTKVKDQKQCGSCWAFSAVGNLEGQYAIKHNELKEFSEQQLVDCDKYDMGCYGGLMESAFIWLKENGGIETEADYPYTGKDSPCKYDQKKAVAKVCGCKFFDIKSEDTLKQYLVSTGPLAIALDAMGLLGYTGGIIDNCDTDELNHGVLLVGYGKENDTPFWIVKNSWGTSFGESGYARMKMYENCLNMTAYVTSAELE